MAQLKLPGRKASTFAAVSIFGVATAAFAQQPPRVPATDSSVQASPTAATPRTGADVDGSAQASPASGPPTAPQRAPAFAPRTALPIVLGERIDSGRLHNGQRLAAKLSRAVGKYPAGTPAVVSVIATTPAGEIFAAGEFSLQLVSVGKSAVYTEIQTFRGRSGSKDLPDSDPAVGTDAGLSAGAPLLFHVQPPPNLAGSAGKAGSSTPGSIDGVAPGGPPPQGAGNTVSGAARSSAQSGSSAGAPPQQSVVPANTTSAPIHGASPSPQHPTH